MSTNEKNEKKKKKNSRRKEKIDQFQTFPSPTLSDKKKQKKINEKNLCKDCWNKKKLFCSLFFATHNDKKL